MNTVAEPINLDCISTATPPTFEFSVSLDEATRKVTHSSKAGAAFNADGFFSANEISYQEVTVVSGMRLSSQYVINRTDLTIKAIFHAEPADPLYVKRATTVHEEHEGICTIVTKKDQKI